MKALYFLLQLATVAITTVAGKNSVFGTIKNDTTWFFSNLSVRPAMTASLEYSVQYPYDESRDRPIITFYYNGQNSPNMGAKCERDLYGQLRNEDLAVPLNEVYRQKFICYHDSEYWYCKGKTKIQDFEPKSYSFSFCNSCGAIHGNLSGLYYNVTIYDESNKTSCVDLNMAQGQRIDRCERSYQYAAVPNQIGGTHLDKTLWELKEAQGIMDEIIDLVTHKSCLLELYQVLCLVALPECLPEQNQIVLPCREYCESLLYNCLEIGPIVILVEEFALNCKYLPSQNDSDHCFMQIDVCGPPLEINHGFILEGNMPFAREGHVVHYACDESYSLSGPTNSMCRKSGEWTAVPECNKPISMILLICVSIGGFTLLVLVVSVGVSCCVRRARNRNHHRRQGGLIQQDNNDNDDETNSINSANQPA